MKKLVFAAQVVGTLVMFPAVVILEMNHGKTMVFNNDSTSGSKQKTEIKTIRTQDWKSFTTEKALSGIPGTFLLFQSL